MRKTLAERSSLAKLIRNSGERQEYRRLKIRSCRDLVSVANESREDAA